VNDALPVCLIIGAGLFLIGAIVGSFLNLCIARIPWEQSVFWPRSRCDHCGAEIGRGDLVPIVGWLMLRGKSRCCGQTIPARYPLIELSTGLGFVLVFVIELAWRYIGEMGPSSFWMSVVAHCICLACLVVIAMIDYDLTIVPAPVTNLGMAAGLLFGLIAPGFRPDPAHADTPLQGLLVGVVGLAVGAALVWLVRVFGHIVFRREAMGLGDVHIMGVIGAFLGWQVAVLSFFLSSFYGLIPSLWKFIPYVWKRVAGKEWRASDREIPLGPFLSLAAITLMLAWPWVWPTVLKPYFVLMEELVRFLLGLEA
jgi:leader peptidase (prepilin peptidase)/N-methyltransferase